jgi:asparagine synthase (glutamine-hydrolysing)
VSFFIFAADSRLDDGVGSFATRAGSAGFRSFFDRRLPNGRLWLFGNQQGESPPMLQREDGDFAVALGSFIYRGDTGLAGLQALYDDFDIARFHWRDLLGIHVLLICKQGVLHVLGDGLGASKIYKTEELALWTSSFIAACEIGEADRFDVQACYEYAINGSVFGTRTPVETIASLPANAALVIGEGTHTRQLADPVSCDSAHDDPGDLDQIADRHIEQLDRVFGPIARHYSDRLRLSFSGGFDSRLMLAMLLRHDARPTLFVYGDDQDEDVRIARLITQAENLDLEIINKDRSGFDPEAIVENARRDLYAFDGWKVEQSLFDFGIDREDRIARHRDGGVALNGSLGEIYRNFHYMADRPFSALDVVSTFYSQYDPAAFTRRFDEQRYRELLAEAMLAAIDAKDRHGKLPRHLVEALYPKFRGRFWTGRDAQINQRFGTMFFPYLEHGAASHTAGIPIRHKDMGRLQGRMIERVNAKLAAYPSDYGFALSGPRPLKYRVKTALGTWRPPALRRLSFRLQTRSPETREGALSAQHLARALDLELPRMRTLFNLPRVFSAQQYGRLASLEFLGQQCDLVVPD